MIYENENDADGILNILQSIHKHVPFNGDVDERQYGEQGIVGDQLSVERAVNGHMSLANGFTPEERLEGLHFEVADWHAGNKFLEVCLCIYSQKRRLSNNFVDVSGNKGSYILAGVKNNFNSCPRE